MSFAMANHGSTFSHWLRNELMKTYGLYSVDSVYVDSIVARSIGGDVDVAPDKRLHMKSPTGAFPIGAMRDDWNALYTTAMRSAEVMLFCYTKEFEASDWCRLEWTQFLLEKSRRGKGTPLRGVILEFKKCELFGSVDESISKVIVKKTDGGGRGMAWDRGDYVLDDSDYVQVVEAIGDLGR
ncbi:MAG: hypothetical protein ACTHXB_04385 [Luteimonas sp.]